jgi:monolysocardiolipin acyltransferase
MDSESMPEVIPMWISGEISSRLSLRPGFDQIMNETRKFPRFIPRPGAKISITVGKPITDQIRPLVDAWRELALKETGRVGIGGDWGGGVNETNVERGLRSKGELAGGEEIKVRKKICEVLQDAVRRLGEEVEAKEGRFETHAWSQSRESHNT